MPVGDILGFGKGVLTGLGEGGISAVKGIGDLAKGGYKLATDSAARDQAWDTAQKVASAAKNYAQNTTPSAAYDDARNGANRLYSAFDKARQDAAAKGASPEFWGNALGRAGFEVGSLLIPVGAATKAGKLGEAARAAEASAEAIRAAGKAAEGMSAATKAADVVADAAKIPNTGVEILPCGRVFDAVANFGATDLRAMNAVEARRHLLSLPYAERLKVLQELVDHPQLLDVSTLKDQAVFYSGQIKTSDGVIKARTLAEKAIPDGKRTLESTPGGNWFDKLKLYPDDTKGIEGVLEPDDADTLWRNLSGRYADSATGDVLVYQGDMRPGAILNKELEVLAAKKSSGVIGNIKRIDMQEMFERLGR